MTLSADEIQDIVQLPKTELHLHLEGTISAATLLRLAAKHKMPLPPHIQRTGTLSYDTFDEFVDTYYAICNALQEPDDFRAAINDVCDYLQRNNIVYAEVSWTPYRYLQQGLDFAEIMHTMNDQLERRGVRSQVGFLIDTQRDHGLEVGKLVYHHAIECKDARIVGIGLTGYEDGFPPSEYSQLFAEARDAGLGCTAHAGEYGSPADIWMAVQDLGVTRIGHGVQAQHDEALLDYLATHHIHIEVCPTSNVRMQRVPTLAEHPLRMFHARGISFGINSDDPAIFSQELSAEFIAVAQEARLTMSDLIKAIEDSIDAAFTTPDHKSALHRRLQDHKQDL